MGPVRALVRRVAATFVASALLAAASACEFDRTTVPQGVDGLVVHAVLNPTTLEQQVLVERTLTGRVDVRDDGAYDPANPIATGGGVPVENASVHLFSETGTSARALQKGVSVPGGPPRGTGLYVFRNLRSTAGDAIEIVPGRSYRLEVRDEQGRLVTGTTRVPKQATIEMRLPVPFNRDTDTLRLDWQPVEHAKQYALRLETPFGPFFLFTDTAKVEIAGSLRNFLTDNLGRAFVPGFDQELIVGAVDANFFDYYRSGSDPFTGSGLITSLQGGTGFFGAYVPILRRDLQVVATRKDPVEGRYLGRGPSGNAEVQLWVAEREGSLSALSGNITDSNGRFGLVGTLVGNELSVAVLRTMNRSDTLFVYRGTTGDDAISLRIQGQTVVFSKAP